MASVLAVCVSFNTEHFQDAELLVIIKEGYDGMLTPGVSAYVFTYPPY